MATELATAYVQIIPSMKDIKSNITDELDSIVNSAERAETAITSVGDSAGSVGSDLDSLGNDAGIAGDELNSLEDDATGLGNDLNGLKDEAGEAGDGLSSMGDEAGSAGSDLGSLSDEADSAGNEVESLASAAGDAVGDIDGLASSADNAGDSLDSLSAVSIDIDTGGAEGSLDDLRDSAENAGDSLEDLNSIGVDIDVDYSALDEIVSAAEDAADSVEGIGDAVDDVDFSNIDNAAESVSTLGDNAGNALGDVGDLGSQLGGALTSGSDDASRAFEGVNSTLDAFVTGGVAAGVATGISEIVEGLMDLISAAQDSQATIAQATGASGQDLEQYKDVAKAALKEVSLASETDLDTVSGVVGELATRFRDLSEEELTEATVKMSDFAAITGQDAVSATDAVASAMKSWGMDTSELSGFLDELTVASQNSGISATELANDLQKDSEQFQAVGYSTSDALAFLADYGSVTGSTSEITTALTRATTNLNGEVDDVPGAFSQAIDAIVSANDPMEALNTEVGNTGMTVEDVFGNRVVQNIYSGVHNGAADLEYFQSALSDASGAVNQTSDDSVTFKDKWQSGFNEVKVGAWNFGSAIKDAFTGASDDVDESTDEMVNAVENTVPEMETAGEDLGNAVVEGVEDAEPLMADAGEATGEAYADGIEGMSDDVGSALDATLAEESSFASQSESEMGSAATTVASEVGSGYDQMESNVDSSLDSAMSDMVNWESQTASTASSAANGIVSNVGSGLSSLDSTVQAPLNTALSNENQWGSDSQKSASDTAKGFVSNTNSGLSSVGDTVSSQLAKGTSQVNSWQEMMKTKATAIGSGFTNNVTSALSPLSGKVGSALSSALSTASGYASRFSSTGSSIGSNLIQGMINGINSRSGSLYSTISSVVNTAVAKANAAAGTHSPSTKLEWTGEMMDKGLALGLNEYSGVVDNAMDDVMSIVDQTASMDYTMSGTANGKSDEIESLRELLEYYLPMLASMQMVIDKDKLVGEMLPGIDKGLGQMQMQKARGLA